MTFAKDTCIVHEGVPVWTFDFPEAKHLLMSAIILVGSNDDGDCPGALHWMEHIPFRGTKLFPKGEKWFESKIGRHGGMCNASVGPYKTVFDVATPVDHWQQGLRFMLDMVVNPLFRARDVKEEWGIIEEEIRRHLADTSERIQRSEETLLHGNHPITRSAAGSLESHLEMTAARAQLARARSYSWRRIVICASGKIPRDFTVAVDKYIRENPLPMLGERRTRVPAGKLRYRKGDKEASSGTPSTFVRFCIPLPKGAKSVWNDSVTHLATSMFDEGGVENPLERVLRVKHQLTYGVSASYGLGPDRHEFNVEFQTSAEKVPQALELMKQVLLSPVATGKSRFNWTKDHFLGQFNMDYPHPGKMHRAAVNTITEFGMPLFPQDLAPIVTDITYADAKAMLETIDLNKAITIVHRGTT